MPTPPPGDVSRSSTPAESQRVPIDGPDPLGVPFWLRRLGALGWRILVVVLLAAVLLGIAWRIGVVTATVIVAVMASTGVTPVVRALRARGWGTSRAAATGTAIVFGGIVLIVAIAAILLVANGPGMVSDIQRGLDELRADSLAGRIPPEVADAIEGLLTAAHGWLGENMGAIGGSVANLGTVLIIGAFTTFYVLGDDRRWWDWATQALDAPHRTAAGRVMQETELRLGGYLRGVAAHAAGHALFTLVVLLVLQVPLALGLATLVFVGGFVPYVGALVAIVAVLLATFAATGWPGMLVLLLLTVVAQIATARWIAPRLTVPESRVSPAVTLIALPIGAYTAGFFGLIVAVPVAITLLAAMGAASVEMQGARDEADRTTIVPRWLDVLAAWSWRLLVGILLIAVLLLPVVAIPMLALPLIIAAVLSATLAPIVSALVARGWGRSLASAGATILVSGTIVILTALSIAILAGNVGSVSDQMNEGAGSANEALGGLGGLLGGLSGEVGGSVTDAVLSVTGTLAAVSVVVTIGVILTFVALRDSRAAWVSLTSHLAPWRRDELDAAAQRSVSVLSGYMLGTGIVSLFGAATQFVMMVVLGAPLALPVFVLAFFSGYIPYIGTAITTLMADLLMLTTGDPIKIAIFVALTLVFNIVQGNFLAPLVFSRAVSVHPAIILLATPAGGALGGMLGMFLVVPVLGLVAATWRTVLVVMGQPPSLASGQAARDDAGAHDQPSSPADAAPSPATG